MSPLPGDASLPSPWQRDWLDWDCGKKWQPKSGGTIFLGFTNLHPSNQVYALGEVREVWVSSPQETHKGHPCAALALLMSDPMRPELRPSNSSHAMLGNGEGRWRGRWGPLCPVPTACWRHPGQMGQLCSPGKQRAG